MLNLNAKKLTRLAIVLGLVAAAMMMILTVGVFADTAIPQQQETLPQLPQLQQQVSRPSLQPSLSDSLHAAVPSEWVFSEPRRQRVFPDSLKRADRSVQASCSDSYSSRQ